jgi:hypothetical protein
MAAERAAVFEMGRTLIRLVLRQCPLAAAARGEVPALVLLKGRIHHRPVKPSIEKYSAFQNLKSVASIRRPTRQRGGSRSSRTVRWDAKDAAVSLTSGAGGVRRSRVVLAPRPWRQVAGKAHAATVARKAAHRGEHEGNRKTFARGRPGCLGCTCQTRVRSTTTIAHGDAGAVGARLSLRPFDGKGRRRCSNPGKSCRGNDAGCLERDKATNSIRLAPFAGRPERIADAIRVRGSLRESQC